MTDKIKVDPKLFITCRLCLQNMGQYQIVPKVQEQIKFCFDIVVEPFDGLPQLLCKKCENTLTEYYKTKSVYVNKQKKLKDRFSLNRGSSVLNQELIDQVQNGFEENDMLQHEIIKEIKNQFEENNVLKKSNYRRITSQISSSSNFSVSSENNDIYDSISVSGHCSYVKQFKCRYCQYITKNQSDMLTHVHKCHRQLRRKHRSVLKQYCVVQLYKFDEKPNATGLNSSAVMFNNDRIMEQVNMDYFILYTSKEDNNYDSENSCDDDNGIIPKKKQRRLRLLSKSSSETMIVASNEDGISNLVIEEALKQEKDQDNKTESEVLECINIDDSDNETDKINDSNKKKTSKRSLQKQKEQLEKITTSMLENYLQKPVDNTNTKKESQSANTESHLKHKLLSIGRKIVNKRGFNCIGLIRYLEQKNIDITWMQTLTKSFNMHSDYIRILTKTIPNNSEEDNTGWKPLTLDETVKKTKMIHIPISSSAVITKEKEETNIESISHNDIVYNNDLLNHNVIQSKSKLLNKNPVANPKKLPRKMVVIETLTSSSTMLPNIQDSFSNNELEASAPISENNTEILMPIITSTTSLALPNNNNIETDVTKPNTDSPVGRIKVKPFSELMSERVINNIANNQQTPLPKVNDAIQYQVALNYVPSTLLQNVGTPMQIIQVPNENVTNVTTSNPQKKEYVILDTVELPNTKTESPFTYLQDLLRIHNILLLDTNEILGTHFTCLIRLKIKYLQENRNQPLVLCLSLFCYNNNFCLKVSDRNQENINLKKIAPIWQWEILTVFKGENIDKVLQNAQKVSNTVYEYTNNFCCLLKSIKCVTAIV